MFNTLLQASIKEPIELEEFFTDRMGHCFIVYRVFAKINGWVIPYRIKEKYHRESLRPDSKLIAAWVYDQNKKCEETSSHYIPIPNNSVYGYIKHDIALQELGNGTNGNQ